MVSPVKASAKLCAGGGACAGSSGLLPTPMSSKSARAAASAAKAEGAAGGDSKSRPRSKLAALDPAAPATGVLAPVLLHVATGTAPVDPALRLLAAAAAAAALGSEPGTPPNSAAAIFSFSDKALGVLAAAAVGV